jgi:hypothetical protein
MASKGSERHREAAAAAATEIRCDLAASGAPSPDEAIVRRAADIVASYPEAWPHYDAPPDDWDGRFAVALLWTWRKVRADRIAPRTRAA